MNISEETRIFVRISKEERQEMINIYANWHSLVQRMEYEAKDYLMNFTTGEIINVKAVRHMVELVGKMIDVCADTMTLED